MITFLKGTLTDALPTQAVVEVNGIGYEVLIPLSSFEKLPALGQAVTLKTQLVVREDSQTLYGFATDDERDLFKMIQNVTGIGPRLALNVLSGMDVASFKLAVGTGDVKRLSSINGIGKKTAERMVLELKDMSFNSSTIRSAVFLPMPLMLERRFTSPVPTASLNDATSIPLRTFSASRGPMPVTF